MISMIFLGTGGRGGKQDIAVRERKRDSEKEKRERERERERDEKLNWGKK